MDRRSPFLTGDTERDPNHVPFVTEHVSYACEACGRPLMRGDVCTDADGNVYCPDCYRDLEEPGIAAENDYTIASDTGVVIAQVRHTDVGN